MPLAVSLSLVTLKRFQVRQQQQYKDGACVCEGGALPPRGESDQPQMERVLEQPAGRTARRPATREAWGSADIMRHGWGVETDTAECIKLHL